MMSIVQCVLLLLTIDEVTLTREGGTHLLHTDIMTHSFLPRTDSSDE